MTGPDKTRLSEAARSAARQNGEPGLIKATALLPALEAAEKAVSGAALAVAGRFGSSPRIPAACEWLLDNRYIAQRGCVSARSAIKKAGRLRSRDGVALLPEACRILVGVTGGRLSEAKIRLFLDEYQSVSVIPGRELGLLPAFLRLALTERLAELCTSLLDSNAPEELTEDFAAVFGSLRLLDGLDNARLVESVDVCEKLLRRDPAGVYPEMDAPSRAYYRQRLSGLAKRTGREEHAAAEEILKLCEDSHGDARHVGYHLFSGERKRSAAPYIAANLLLTLFLSLLCGYLTRNALTALLLLLPVSELTKCLLDYIILLCVPPRRIPRLELKNGVPDDAGTVCVISALLSSPDAAAPLVRRLEELYLASPGCGKNLRFGILADLPEADAPVTRRDAELISSAAKRINALNEKYGGGFYLLTRERTEDRGRGKYCGFDRKRGAVLALAELLCGREDALIIAAGDAKALSGARYIITLDSDTVPSPGSLTELIGAMAHPLNRPVPDRERGCVVSGHGLIHPRMGCVPESASATDFSRINAGQGGIEPYSVLCGELYSDLFGLGGFSGKGIIDAESLCICSGAHIPEGRILSHDALEGAYLRGGYMSDTEFCDSFPSTPAAFLRRAHRWMRGDWQNAGYIAGRHGLCAVDRFKLYDSLRRSLVAPMTFIAVLAGLLVPEHGLKTAAWAALISLASGVLIALAEYASGYRGSGERYHSRLYKGVAAAFSRTLLRLWLLPTEAVTCLSAAGTALWRMLVSGKNLLEWETAAQSELKKSGLSGCILNNLACIAAGLLLLVSGSGAGAVITGLFWLVAPLAAFAVGLPARARPGVSARDGEYLRSCAADIWSYFDKLCTPEDNYLPPDNFQEQPPIGAAHRTSPTNIGFCLVSALCAKKLGLDADGRALRLIENILTTLEKMPRYRGHFANWCDTGTLRSLEPEYISTVDSGNLCASLIALGNGLTELGEFGLAERAKRLSREMDFSVLYNEERGLLHVGLTADGTPSEACYDLMSGEARLTSYLAIAKGDIPREHWRRLSRVMRSLGGYKGMASWTGTMFEYLMPELFLPLTPDTLQYETARFCLYAQKHRRTESGLWGISESAFFSLDPALSYRYKAHGCPSLALKRGQELDLVISPYSSFLALCLEPSSAVKNLRRIEAAGYTGRFGFIEAIDFTPSRCRGSDGEPVSCYMAHHLGMSMLSLTNLLCGGYVRELFMSEPAMSAYRSLLREKLPVNAPVLPPQQPAPEPSSRRCSGQWTRRGSDLDFEYPSCAVLSNGSYSILVSESGITRSTLGDVLIMRPPARQLGDGHGAELYLEHSGGRVSLLPEPDGDGGFLWELGESVCSWQHVGSFPEARVSCAAAGSVSGELRRVELTLPEASDGAELVFSFEPVLADRSDYLGHPAFWRLGLEAEPVGGCLLIRRLPGGRQRERFLCLACDKKARFSADRLSGTGAVSSPEVRVSVPVSGERVTCSFAVCTADSADAAIAGAQQILCMNPSGYGRLPSACASLTGLSERGIDAAMRLITPLWFPRAGSGVPKKRELWKHGISGDLPILLCPPEALDRDKAAELTRQFILLRSCGLCFDLVLIADEDGEYDRPVYGAVRDTLALSGLESFLGIGGGIRILPPSAQAELKAAAAHIIGSAPPERSAGRRYTLPDGTPRPLRGKPDCGYDADGSFVVRCAGELPPRVWSSVLTNGSLGYLAADSGCGNMWLGNAREQRLTRWVNDPLAVTGPETLEFISSSGRHSVFAAPDGIPCRIRFGFGYTVWEKSFGSQGVRTTAFIPDGTDARVLVIELCGEPGAQLAWSLEPLLGSEDADSAAVTVSREGELLTAKSSRSLTDITLRAAFSEAPTAWTGDLFSLYRGEYDEKLSCPAVPAFCALLPCRRISVIAVGTCEPDKLRALCSPEAAMRELERVKRRWRGLVTRQSLELSAAFTPYMNGWAVYQTLASRLLGRCSVYQSGGAVGFRDQLQDAVNMLLVSSGLSRRQILLCCAHQYAEGDVMHWWHSLPEGERGVRTRCSDDLLWLPWALCEYVEKTGDTAICSERVCYLSSKPLAAHESDRYELPLRTDMSETVLSHAKRALELAFSRGTGAHGLLLFGSGDWNDGFDRVRGESVWLSFFFSHVASRFAELLTLCGMGGAERCRELAKRLGSAADRAWDKDHYLRGYWPDGAPLGSDGCDECRIDSVAQSWAALCEFADKNRVDTALDTALVRLYDREHGLIKLFDPPFHASARDPGYIMSYGRGFRENGGQYTHAAVWLALACLIRGRRKDAVSILSDLIPHGEDYLAEPFVLPADVYTAPGHTGEAGWTWYTGSAGWFFRVVYEELLGLRLHSGLLYIRPRLPDGFPELRIRLTAAGKVRVITVRDGDVSLDGEKYDGKGIPFF